LIPNKQASSCDLVNPANGDKNNKGSVKEADIDIWIYYQQWYIQD
jgi:hypothetical protein